MLNRRTNCMICGYDPVCIGGYWTFMPLFCCETKRAKRMISHRKKGR